MDIRMLVKYIYMDEKERKIGAEVDGQHQAQLDIDTVELGGAIPVCLEVTGLQNRPDIKVGKCM